MRPLRAALALAVVLIPSTSLAQPGSTEQPTYYVYQGQRIHLDIDPSSIAVRVSPGTADADLLASAFQEGIRTVDPTAIPGWAFLRMAVPRESPGDVAATIDRLLKLTTVRFTGLPRQR